MPVRVGFEVVWIPQPALIARAFFASAERARTMEEPMKEATIIAATEIDLNFEMEGRPDHWAPLAASTIERRLQMIGMGTRQLRGYSSSEGFVIRPPEEISSMRSMGGANLKILQRTGSLRAAAVDASSWIFGGGGQDVIATLNDPTGYGHFHITGAPGVPMPQRDYTYLSPEGQQAMEDEFTNWVMEPIETMPSATGGFSGGTEAGSFFYGMFE